MAKQKLVVLSGAGISAESGLKTFRDSDGLWEGYDIEEVATPRAWRRNPQLVLDFYNMRRKNVLEAQPNAAHIGLAKLEEYYVVHIITQNIDDLHERAGSTNVLHLHGEILKMRSERNEHKLYPITEDINYGDLAEDGSQFRPHVVWFEEPVPMIEQAIPIMMAADIFVLIGTSLAVYPAAGLVEYVSPEVTKYVIDKRIPSISMYHNVVPIEKPATEGIQELLQLLKL
ncbi:MAG: SIR2 family NAD-dependent protein deacylase [Flavipsychrobacter sp.]